MRTHIMRAFVAVAATMALTALGLAGTETATAAVPRVGLTSIDRVPPSAPSRVNAPRASGLPAGTVGIVGLLKTSFGYCSATALNGLNGHSKRLIITAAHCIYDKDYGGWATDEIFIPGFSYDQATNHWNYPYGQFTVKSTYYYQQWIDHADPAFDYAILAVNDNQYGSLVDVVGGAGLRTSYPSVVKVTAIGYPRCAPSNGSCPGQETISNYSTAWYGSGRISLFAPGWYLGGGAVQGASGGPWLQDFDPNSSSVTGYVNGVTSKCAEIDVSCHLITSPYFDQNVWNLFKSADSQS